MDSKTPSLREAIIQASILYYPNVAKKYIVYMDVSEDTCQAQI